MTVLVVVLCGHQPVLLYVRYRRELAEWEEVIEKEKVEAKQFIKYVCVGSNRFGDSLQSPSSLGVLSVAISWFCLRRRDIYFLRDMEEERVVNFLNLRPENADALRTYLTPEQAQLVQKGSEMDSTFTAEWTKQLENIVNMHNVM